MTKSLIPQSRDEGWSHGSTLLTVPPFDVAQGR